MDPLRAAPGADIVLAAVAGEPGVHVVGGAVRDALRGQVPRELDLVVEGDAVSVARRAAERVGGELTVHERFGTATVRTGDFAFDLAGARRETYERPGRAADGRARRDDRGGPGAPRLHRQRDRGQPRRRPRSPTWPGAREDLDAGVLRVLHDRSFVDDPTRMLRLVRYAARLEFAADPHTEALIDPALLRHRDRRPRSATSCGCCCASRAARSSCSIATGWAGRCSASASQSTGSPSAPAPGCSRSRRAAPRSTVRRSPPASTTSGSRGRTEMSSWPRRAASSAFTVTWTARDADVWRLLRRERVETVQLLAAAGDEGAQRWLDRIRHRKLAISGDDLVAAGLTGAAGGGGAGARDGRDARRPRAGPRGAAARGNTQS